jgi:hypothetical protein
LDVLPYCPQKIRCPATRPVGWQRGERQGGDASLLAPMLLSLFTIIVLVLASLRVNAASVTSVLIANEAASSPGVNIADVDQVHTTIRSGFADLGGVGSAQNQMVETRREYEDSLKTYREFAKKEPETYLPYLAATLDQALIDFWSDIFHRLHPL